MSLSTESVRQCIGCGRLRPVSCFRGGASNQRRKCKSCGNREYRAQPFERNEDAARNYIVARVRAADCGHSTPCWVWQRATDERGYARTAVTGYSRFSAHVHRASYEVFVGPIPEGLHIDHLCENKSCVNPTHLEPVTNAENMRRRYERAAARRSCGGGAGVNADSGHLRQGMSLTHSDGAQ